MNDLVEVYADFNSRTADGFPWILKYGGKDLDTQLDLLKIRPGDWVLLYQDEVQGEHDFTVPAQLANCFVDELGHSVLCAIPDWTQLVKKGQNREG
jgi:hypothetical protein